MTAQVEKPTPTRKSLFRKGKESIAESFRLTSLSKKVNPFLRRCFVTSEDVTYTLAIGGVVCVRFRSSTLKCLDSVFMQCCPRCSTFRLCAFWIPFFDFYAFARSTCLLRDDIWIKSTATADVWQTVGEAGGGCAIGDCSIDLDILCILSDCF